MTIFGAKAEHLFVDENSNAIPKGCQGLVKELSLARQHPLVDHP